jgi:hypothetical protein
MSRFTLAALVLLLAAPAVATTPWADVDPALTVAPETAELSAPLSYIDMNYAGNNPSIDAFGDIIWGPMDVDTGNGGGLRALGVAYDWNTGHIWTTNSMDMVSMEIHEWDAVTQTLLNAYPQTGVPAGWGMRDLAFDGTYLYAGEASGWWRIDPSNGAILNFWPAPAGLTTVRALAVDARNPNHLIFYSQTFGDPLYMFDTTSTVLASLDNTESAYGAAFDDWSSYAPTLWLHANAPTEMIEIDEVTLVPTGVRFFTTTPWTSEAVGGCEMAPGLADPDLPILGLHQGTPDHIVGYEIDSTYVSGNWVTWDFEPDSANFWRNGINNPNPGGMWAWGPPQNSSYLTFQPPPGSVNLWWINSDLAGSGAGEITDTLFTPSMDMSSATSCSLGFWLHFATSSDQLDLLASGDGGATWTVVNTWTSNYSGNYTGIWDMTTIWAGNSSCLAAWRYTDSDTWGYGALVDDVSVFPAPSFPDLNDVGVMAVYDPVDDAILLPGALTDPNATAKNYGDFAEDFNFICHAYDNGIVLTYGDTLAVTGLAAGDTVNNTFAQHTGLAEGDSALFVFYTDLADDNPNNDSTEVWVYYTSTVCVVVGDGTYEFSMWVSTPSGDGDWFANPVDMSALTPPYDITLMDVVINPEKVGTGLLDTIGYWYNLAGAPDPANPVEFVEFYDPPDGPNGLDFWIDPGFVSYPINVTSPIDSLWFCCSWPAGNADGPYIGADTDPPHTVGVWWSQTGIGGPWNHFTSYDFSARVCVMFDVGAPEEAQVLPGGFVLYSAYPNPFNPTTVISFDLPSESHVSVDIYNVLGQKVTTLNDGSLPAGHHEMNWDASNVGSGVYFARVTTEHNRGVVKMMLLK